MHWSDIDEVDCANTQKTLYHSQLMVMATESVIYKTQFQLSYNQSGATYSTLRLMLGKAILIVAKSYRHDRNIMGVFEATCHLITPLTTAKFSGIITTELEQVI